MPPFTPRSRCLHGHGGPITSSACSCMAWVPDDHTLDLSVATIDSMVPTRPTDRCGYCDHPWYAHQARPENQHGRGMCFRTNCGGFFRETNQVPLTTRSICVCSADWGQHELISQPGTRSERPIPGGSNMNISPPSPAQAVSSISAYQSRVAQFVPPPSHPVFPTPGNSRSQSIQRLGASNRNHRGRRNQYPQGPTLSRSGIAPPPPGLTVTVVIVPFKLRVSNDIYMINDQCTPPEIRIQPSDIEVFLDILRNHHLVTDLAFPDTNQNSDSPMWIEFDFRLKEYLSSIGADFAEPSSLSFCDLRNQSTSQEYHNLPWLLLKGSRLRDGRRKLIAADPIIFSPNTLCSSVGKWARAESSTSNQPLLFIGCRFTEINAPLTTFQDVEEPNIRHCCFAIRMYDAISKTRVLPQHECIPSDIVIDCHGDCPCFSGVPNSPTPSPPATPPPDITRIIRSHPRSPNSNDDENPAPRARQRIHGPSWELTDPTLPPLSISSSSNEDINSVILTWRTCLQLFADTCATESETFTIHGDSLDSVSHGFLLFLQHLSHVALSGHRAWILPDGISECRPLDFRSLLKQTIAFEVGPAMGQGVERSVFETIFRRLGTREFEKSDLFWNSADRFLVPRFEPGEPASFRSRWWYTFGRLLGLYVVRFGQVPRRISPVLLLGLFSTRLNEMFVTLDTLIVLDKELAESLRPWYEIPIGGTPLPEFSRGVINLLAGRAQMDPAIIRGDISSREEHIAKTCQIMCAVGLGRADLWSNPEFRQFREGFDIVLTNINQDLHSLIGYTRNQISNRIGGFITALCDRRVQQPSQVWELCVFGELTDWVAVAPFRQRAQMFQSCFHSYLFGSGAPESPPGEHLEELGDVATPATVIRSATLLAAVTECEDLPSDPDHRIQFNWFSISETETPTLAIHTCNRAVDVFLTQELEDIMMNRNGAPSFDHWVHRVLICSRGFYNRI